jgi:hypothetical protein
MHTNLCKNCVHTFQGNFCSNCGQKTNTKRIDWNYVYDELKYTFLHFNNGLLYTSKQLYTRPGYMIREFLEGKRVKHYKPILMVFVLAGITGFLMHYVKIEQLVHITHNKFNSNNPDFSKKTILWITNHYTIVELLLLPIISLASWISFRKWGYNFIENIIINSFATSQRLLFSIITFPVLFFVDKESLYIKNLINLPEFGLTIWTFWQLYSEKSIGQKIWRIVLFGIMTLLIFIVMTIITTGIYLVYVNFFNIK